MRPFKLKEKLVKNKKYSKSNVPVLEIYSFYNDGVCVANL